MKTTQAHNQKPRYLKDILLLFSIPIGIITILIGFLYVPRLFANPAYDFIYCEGYYCDSRFSVNPSGNLHVTQKEDSSYSYRYNSNLFYYDSERDATRPIQVEDATRYRLDPTSKSPDGYTLKRTSNSSGFLFWSSQSSGWSLSRGLVSKPVSLNTYDSSHKFIGWVLP